MNLLTTLQSTGLTEKQAKVYLAALELGPASILKIAQKSGIKRPTCYVLLEELTRRNLVSPTNPQKSRYTAADPSTLMFHVEQQRQNLQAILPDLQAKNFHTQGRPAIQVYTRRQGWDALAQLHIRNSHMHRFYANISHNTPKQDDITKTLLISTQSQHAHNIRAIFVGKTPPTTLTTGIPRLQWKTVSAENNNPATLIIIDNAVIYPTIADSWDKSSWLVLQSTSIQSAQVSMFEALWAQTAEPTSPSKPQPRTPNRPKPSPKGPAGLTKLPGFMRK